MEKKTVRTPIGNREGQVINHEPSGEPKEVLIGGVIYVRVNGSDCYVIKR